MNYFVYILECNDTTLYVGSTNNLERRLREHNTSKKAARYTRMRRPVVLKYSEQVATLSDARKREYVIKQWSRDQKRALIKNT